MQPSRECAACGVLNPKDQFIHDEPCRSCGKPCKTSEPTEAYADFKRRRTRGLREALRPRGAA